LKKQAHSGPAILSESAGCVDDSVHSIAGVILKNEVHIKPHGNAGCHAGLSSIPPGFSKGFPASGNDSIRPVNDSPGISVKKSTARV
jgi:hypothetical protein